jgi:hypothetical protein
MILHESSVLVSYFSSYSENKIRDIKKKYPVISIIDTY